MATRIASLSQIGGDNIARLGGAWSVPSPDAHLSVTMPGGGGWTGAPAGLFAELNRLDPARWRDGASPIITNFKATPLMVGGLLYLNTPTSGGAAYDAATGKLRWQFNPKSYTAGTTTMSLRWHQRGVACWHWCDRRDSNAGPPA